MRVLVANKFWYRRGGLERVMFDEIAWLEQAGYEVAHFSTAHPENQPSPWSDYFAPYLELGRGGGLSPRERATAAVRLFHNREAARRFTRLVDDFAPHLVHIHGIHRQISPSILDVARRKGLPVVQSLHDYHHICPADTLLRLNGGLCSPPRCGSLWYGPCVSGRCAHGSLPVSVLSASETTWARLRRAYRDGVKRFISPSDFLAGQMRLGGWRLPIDVIPNAVRAESSREGPGEGFACIGRLSREKGVEVALEAAAIAGVPLTVAGDGPLRAHLQTAYPEAMFTGRLNGRQVRDLVLSVRAVLVPSLWFENAPMSVLEPMAVGVPAIASRIGGIPEQVADDINGLLVEPGDVSALVTALRRVQEDPGLGSRLGDAARRTVAERFSPDHHLASLQKTYELSLRP